MVIHHQLCQDKAFQNLLKPYHNWRSWPLSPHFTDGRQGREVTCLVTELITDMVTRATSACSSPLDHHQRWDPFSQHETGAKPKTPSAHPDSSCSLHFRILPVILFMAALGLHCCVIFTAATMRSSAVVWASPCGGLSCRRAQPLRGAGFIPQLQHVGSVVAVHGA